MRKHDDRAKADLGMTLDEAMRRGVLFRSYQILGKYYTAEIADTAPAVKLGQCPQCGEFTWDEEEDKDFGNCSSCEFSG